jgi:nitroreductase
MLNLLYQRRSIRKYQQIPIEKEKVEKLIRASLLAPSARGSLSQKFIVVEDKNILEKLSRSREHGASFLKNAPLAIAILGDSSITDVWVEDTSIAAITIQYVAKSLGLGSCWIQVRNRQHNQDLTSEEYIQELLAIPENLKVECILAIGYPDEQKPNKTDEELGFERVSFNGYGK